MLVYGWPISVKVAMYLGGKIVGQLGQEGLFQKPKMYEEEMMQTVASIEDTINKWSIKQLALLRRFIKNRFLWDDCFSSMEMWSMVVIPQSKPVWVDISGVPLSYWNDFFFFLKVGWVLGVHLMVEDETLKKRRFDKGRLLVLLPFDYKCPAKIKVVQEKCLFLVTFGTFSSSVEYQWVARHVGLKMEEHQASLNSILKMDKTDKQLGNMVFQSPFLSINQGVSEKSDGEV
ncbi:hypothetical protein Q3G72_017559 [Acer saccharum]|nr:hypothetical protein Q3G72_017559 [Acer saccharum]